ncbi:MAG: carbohydrate kinase [Cyanophyceae cyanobacterium]
MQNPRVICLGEVLFDLIADQKGRALAEVESWSAYPGGAPANVACALVKLGTPTAFVGCVGEDRAGTELVELLQSVGVETSGIQRHPSAPTRQVYTLRSAGGDRSFVGFSYGDAAQPEMLAPDRFADAYLQADYLPSELFAEADFLITGTLELAYAHSQAAVLRALELAKQYEVKIMVDVNWRPIFWKDDEQAKQEIEKLWPLLDFLKVSQEEAEWLFGSADAGEIARQLGAAEGVVVSAGDAPVSYYLGGSAGTVAPFDVDVQDTTGAGDSFVAGIVHQLVQQGLGCLSDPKKAQAVIAYACAVGGMTATKAGAIASQPTAAEVETFLQKMS